MLLYSAQMAAILDSHGSFRAFSGIQQKIAVNGAVTFGAASASAQGGVVRHS
jgi:hypothetical protein